MLRAFKKTSMINLIVFSVILTLFMSLISGCGKNTSVQEVWGRAEGKEIDVNSKIPGRVISLLVKEGDQVEKGQLLASVDNRDIVAKANQAKAGIKALESQLAQSSTLTDLQDQTLQASLTAANAQLENAQANLSLTEKDVNRYNELAASGAISQQSLDVVRAKYQSAQAAYRQAQAGVESAEASLLQGKANRENQSAVQGKINQAQASLEEVEVNLDETEIRAPFSGIVTTKYVEQGAMISTGTPIVAIQDPLDNWVNIKVKETELDHYQLNQTVQLEGRDAALKLSGTIIDISKKPEFATYRATNERGDNDIITFNVKIQVNSEKVRPGMRFKLMNGDK